MRLKAKKANACIATSGRTLTRVNKPLGMELEEAFGLLRLELANGLV